MFLSHKKKLSGEGLFEFFLDAVTKGEAPPNRDTFGDVLTEWAEAGFTYDMCTPLTESGACLMESVLSMISTREEEVIRMTFGIGHEKLTLCECGEKLACTGERVRQIQAKALRKLRHPIRAGKLVWVIGNPEDLSHKFLVEMVKQLIPKEPMIVEVKSESEEPKQKDLAEIFNTSVEELNISVRGYNCLKNADIQTVRDLVQISEAQYLHIKNTGRKSLNELKELLKDMGGLHFDMKFDAEGNLVTPLLTREEPEESLW
jgi:hypothetical protein